MRNKVIEGIERNSGGLLDIDLGERPPVSRLRLLGIDYEFDKDIDKKALAEITNASKEELNEIKEFGFDILKNFKQNFAKETLREKTRKKEQLETLKFLHQTGFDLIP